MTELKLKYPFEFDGASYTKVTIRRPKAGDFEAMERELGEDTNKVHQPAVLAISRLSGWPIDVVRELDLIDYGACNDLVADFLAQRDSTESPSAA